MESTNLHQQEHHHQLQDQLVGSSVPTSLSPCFVVPNNDAWRNTPTFFLNNTNIHANSSDEASPNSLNNNSMIQDMGISWLYNDIQSSSHNKIKEESSTSSDQTDTSSLNFPSFSEMLSPSTSSSAQLLLLKTLSPSYTNYNMLQQPISKGMTAFSQIFPSVNISNLSSNGMSPVLGSSSTTTEMNNVQGGLDLFNQATPSSHLLDLFNGRSQFCVDHELQHSSDHKLCNSTNNLSSLNNNGALESESSGYIVEPKSIHQTASKKQRSESRSSCPPFKVRKEKLGDRIAALQQLVAPFGKTDTASVLMEAIGYIKFLENQVETLSVPYMKLASRNKSSNNIKKISDEYCETIDHQKPDLRSRGLCLVPLSCMSYIAADHHPGINGGWPPPIFNPGF